MVGVETTHRSRERSVRRRRTVPSPAAPFGRARIRQRTASTQSQAELLRLVGRSPASRSGRPQRNWDWSPIRRPRWCPSSRRTVCSIRDVDADDRRVGRLRLTAPAQRIADKSRTARRADDGGGARRTGRRRRSPPWKRDWRYSAKMTHNAAREAAIDVTRSDTAGDRLPPPRPTRYGRFHRRRRFRPSGASPARRWACSGPTAQARPPSCGC